MPHVALRVDILYQLSLGAQLVAAETIGHVIIDALEALHLLAGGLSLCIDAHKLALELRSRCGCLLLLLGAEIGIL